LAEDTLQLKKHQLATVFYVDNLNKSTHYYKKRRAYESNNDYEAVFSIHKFLFSLLLIL